MERATRVYGFSSPLLGVVFLLYAVESLLYWLGLVPGLYAGIVLGVSGLVYGVAVALGVRSRAAWSPDAAEAFLLVLAGGAAVSVVSVALGFVSGFSLNGVAAGRVAGLVVSVPWLLGSAVVASAAAQLRPLLGLVLGLLGIMAVYTTLNELVGLPEHSAEFLASYLAREVVPWVFMVTAVVFLARRCFAAGPAYVVAAWVLPAYFMPVAPAVSAEAVALMQTFVHAVVASSAAFMSSARRGGGGLTGLVALGALALGIVAAVYSGYYMFVVLTGSMEPSLVPGDIVVTAPVDPSEVRVGDVVAWVDPERRIVVIHRVVEVREGPRGLVFVTKGDANEVPDDPFGERQLVGRVVLRLPRLGLPYLVLGEALGSGFAASAVLLLLSAMAAILAVRGERRLD